jgi:DNA-binding NtrC family response regulator
MGSSRWFTVADLRGRASNEDPGPLILVADDHASVASAVSRCLAEAGTVLAPVTTLGLMHRVVPLVYPLVLVGDLDFEGVFALDTLRDMNLTHPAIRVIAYSGHANEVIWQMVGKAGLFGFVAKLDPLEKLRAVIELACGELDREPVPPGQRRSEVGEERGRRKAHDVGGLIRWALDSGFKPTAITRVLRVSPQTVTYHRKALSAALSG